MRDLHAVVFDWRGTLVTTLSPREWVRTALEILDRDAGPGRVTDVWARVATAAGEPDRLDAPGVDADAALHHDTYHGVFADAGLDRELADALYAVESDPTYNPFAVDVAATLRAISGEGVKIAVLSDIHFDLRPAFAAEGIEEIVDAFVLSYESGLQKPDPAVFRLTLERLGAAADQALMVGDRQQPDGGAVTVGMTTLLLPPLKSIHQRRLHRVTSLLGLSDHP